MFQLLLIIIYLAFISLGLPDGLLGAAWPTLRLEMGLPVSYMGMISMIISVGTVISSLQSDRLSKKYGTGLVTAVSVLLTALALFGFGSSTAFWQLILFAIPYGLGAGSVDAAINNYVALHYSSKHMSWLHCMWGVGAASGPYVMSWVLAGGGHWHSGYLIIGLVQIMLTVGLFFSLPLWQKNPSLTAEDEHLAPLSLAQIVKLKGAKEIMVAFFCYCGLELTMGLWASTYLVGQKGVDAVTAAAFASLFYLGMMLGRGLNGFLAIRFNDSQLIRMGQAIILVGILILFLPIPGTIGALTGLSLVGLGCAPIYPCIIHSTPEHFGKQNSQAVIGVEMASAYVGMTVAPPLFGFLSRYLGLGFYPVFLLIILLIMIVMHERVVKLHAS